MNDQIIFIPLDKIKPRKNLKTSLAYLRRMEKCDKNLLIYDLLLPVEKNKDDNSYLLVGGYDKYKYILSSGRKTAPCIIEPSSNKENQQNIKILRRLSNNGDSSKENRQIVLGLIRATSSAIEPILKTIGLTGSEYTNNYTYHSNIPKEFINEYTSEKTMNWIEKLSLTQEVKNFLYERAGFPKGTSKRLTQEKMNLIQKLLNQRPQFYDLGIKKQIKILGSSINFRGIYLELLKSMVDEFYEVPKVI
ncbi:hypothetical protein NSA47_05635 [Irregularibacter muris]|uniref:ParB/Sulfiredoxin domain-containing protein n=1 Tax=Irregularibacter muris TaxID=1796619 RepID=A0AAE3KZL7_9FIRM|nr:hypothetical protein [Irregularibacter muris]MCR1898472.1 hypothetical protein [Irregularibacter muris]